MLRERVNTAIASTLRVIQAQPPQKEFSRPSQQQVVAATDPNYETMRGLSNKELFQTNKKVQCIDQISN